MTLSAPVPATPEATALSIDEKLFKLAAIISQVALRTVNLNKLTSAGCVLRFWVADRFAMLINKVGGDSDKIRLVGQYMVEIWKSVGMDMASVEFLWASKVLISHSASYWLRVMDIARRTTIARTLKRCKAV